MKQPYKRLYRDKRPMEDRSQEQIQPEVYRNEGGNMRRRDDGGDMRRSKGNKGEEVGENHYQRSYVRRDKP